MKPQIFQQTIYRVPTNDELKNLNKCNLTAEEILEGFKYTIIGRGINSSDNINKIIESINNLVEMYPNNIVYQTALKNAKGLKPKSFGKIQESFRKAITQYIHG
jgi:hypothetical protein